MLLPGCICSPGFISPPGVTPSCCPRNGAAQGSNSPRCGQPRSNRSGRHARSLLRWVLFRRGRLMSKAVLTRTRDGLAGSAKWRRAALIAVAITRFFFRPMPPSPQRSSSTGRSKLRPSPAAPCRWGTTKGVFRSLRQLPLARRRQQEGDLRGRPDDRSPQADDRPERIQQRPDVRRRPPAGTDRTNDFEAIAYDRANDVLYVFSGNCCTSSILPTAFRLTRQSGQFQVESYQPLPTGADYPVPPGAPPTERSTWARVGMIHRSTTRPVPRARRSGLAGSLESWEWISRRTGPISSSQ